MYSWEIKNYIAQRGYQLNQEEIKEVIDILKNPQLDHIEYNAYDDRYEMWDREGNYFTFKVKYEDELVRKREKGT